MNKLINNLGQGITIGLGIVITVGISGIVYASTVSSGETLTADLFNEKTVPTTAVMAFAASSCPIGWSYYIPAQGRFIRGIDKTGTNIDPDGERVFGNIQEDDLKSHNHTAVLPSVTNSYRNNLESGSKGNQINSTKNTSSFGGNETRSKNVALLYCIKD